MRGDRRRTELVILDSFPHFMHENKLFTILPLNSMWLI